jgi:hypothetical protein
MVTANYNTIKNYYQNLVAQQAQYGLQIDPYGTAISYWISLIKNNCSWDYKTKSPYNVGSGYLCLTYARGDNVHKPSGGEYMGNYNFGYTGKYLFSLSVLKIGSFVYGGFKYDFNEKNDHAVITEGYNDAP